MSRRRLRIVAILAVLVVAFGALTAPLLVWPAEGMPPRVSAIVMLAGPGARLQQAVALARQGRAPMLAISRGSHGYGSPCPEPVPGVRLICFEPDPADTRGEAEVVGRLARQYHWHSVVLVTTRGQDTRARLLVGRCFAGSVYVVTTALSWTSWPYQIAYGWGALAKALVVYRSC